MKMPSRHSRTSRSARTPGSVLSLHPTHYERLSLSEDASAERIQAVLAGLPEIPITDRRPDNRALQLAREVLADPLRRSAYDRYLARERVRHAPGSAMSRWRSRPLAAASISLCALGGVLFWLRHTL